MLSRKGSLLEKDVERLLKLAGFKPQLNKIYKGYEIDVFLSYTGTKIGFECKQYEKSSLSVRNLIHQWNSKNKEINLTKIVLVLMGCDISAKDRELARKYNITIWDEKKLNNLLDYAIEKKATAQDEIFKEIGVNLDKNIKTESRKEETEQQTQIQEAIEDMIKKKMERIKITYLYNKNFSIIIKDDEDISLIIYGDYWSSENFSFLDNFSFIVKKLEQLDVEEYGKDGIPYLNINQYCDFNIIKHFHFPFKFDKDFEIVQKRKDDRILVSGICINCGKNIKLAAKVCDLIFRKVFEVPKDYEINIKYS